MESILKVPLSFMAFSKIIPVNVSCEVVKSNATRVDNSIAFDFFIGKIRVLQEK